MYTYIHSLHVYVYLDVRNMTATYDCCYVSLTQVLAVIADGNRHLLSLPVVAVPQTHFFIRGK